MNKHKSQTLDSFKETIWNFYHAYGRDFAWRNIDEPYKIVVSEVMLQQTQAHRVIHKYEQFIEEFSSFKMLAQASLRDVLTLWQGLGYNRRGKFLHLLAQRVVKEYGGVLPSDAGELIRLPGIGPATSASICAFAFNQPTIFIETNIRAVYLHFFFQEKKNVDDKELFPLITQTVDNKNPREWYYALMDYGVMLKQTIPNPSKRSKHHTRQSKFEGSDRQIRGKIIRHLTEFEAVSCQNLLKLCGGSSNRLDSIIKGLLLEKIIKRWNDTLSIC